jgi:hypothetical protein
MGSPVKFFVLGGQNGRIHVTIALLLPSPRRRPLTKYELATSADSKIDEIECYYIIPLPKHQFIRLALNNFATKSLGM